jgi:hypothetical protein
MVRGSAAPAVRQKASRFREVSGQEEEGFFVCLAGLRGGGRRYLRTDPAI